MGIRIAFFRHHFIALSNLLVKLVVFSTVNHGFMTMCEPGAARSSRSIGKIEAHLGIHFAWKFSFQGERMVGITGGTKWIFLK